MHMCNHTHACVRKQITEIVLCTVHEPPLDYKLCLFFLGKVPSYTVFYAINIKKSHLHALTRLSISEKTSHLHNY